MNAKQRKDIKEQAEALARSAKRLREAADWLARKAREGYYLEDIRGEYPDVRNAFAAANTRLGELETLLQEEL